MVFLNDANILSYFIIDLMDPLLWDIYMLFRSWMLWVRMSNVVYASSQMSLIIFPAVHSKGGMAVSKDVSILWPDSLLNLCTNLHSQNEFKKQLFLWELSRFWTFANLSKHNFILFIFCSFSTCDKNIFPLIPSLVLCIRIASEVSLHFSVFI